MVYVSLPVRSVVMMQTSYNASLVFTVSVGFAHTLVMRRGSDAGVSPTLVSKNRLSLMVKPTQVK